MALPTRLIVILVHHNDDQNNDFPRIATIAFFYRLFEI